MSSIVSANGTPKKAKTFDRLMASYFCATLIGKSNNWVLTLVFGLIVSKVGFLAIWIPLVLMAPHSPNGFSGRMSDDLGRDIFVLVFFCPFFESLIVWFSLWLFASILRLRRRWALALAGLIHVPLHGLTLLSFSVLPFFLLNALILQNYRDRGRSGAGYALLVAFHAIYNGLAIWVIRSLR